MRRHCAEQYERLGVEYDIKKLSCNASCEGVGGRTSSIKKRRNCKKRETTDPGFRIGRFVNEILRNCVCKLIPVSHDIIRIIYTGQHEMQFVKLIQ